MSYANHIWELLEPLGVYQKSGTFQMGEIQAQGAVLDQVDGLLAELEGDYKVCPGHGPLSSLEDERRTNPYMRQAMGR